MSLDLRHRVGLGIVFAGVVGLDGTTSARYRGRGLTSAKFAGYSLVRARAAR